MNKMFKNNLFKIQSSVMKL